MENSKIINAHWYLDRKTIVTQISGEINKDDVEQWEKMLDHALQQIEDHSTFKILINLFGFHPDDIETHKRFREIIPLKLAEYGWKVGYVDLFRVESQRIKYLNKRGIKCVAAAHVHHDVVKFEQYEAQFGKNIEHFFTDPDQAERWIESLD